MTIIVKRHTRRSIGPFEHLSNDLLYYILSFLDEPNHILKYSMVNKEWYLMGKKYGLKCFLIGNLWKNLHEGFLGSYILLPYRVNGYFAYTMINDRIKCIWGNYDNTDKRIEWYCGIYEELGDDRGRLMMLNANHDKPYIFDPNSDKEQLKNYFWNVALNNYSRKNQWMIQNVICGIGVKAERYAYIINSRRDNIFKNMPQTIKISTNYLFKNNVKIYFGNFELSDILANNKYVYVKKNKKYALWYDNRCWVVGRYEDIGTHKGSLALQDDCIVPTMSQLPWQIAIPPQEYRAFYSDSLNTKYSTVKLNYGTDANWPICFDITCKSVKSVKK